MVIWLHGNAGGVGVEDGIVPAAMAGGVAELDALRHTMDEQREQVLAAARVEAQALLEQARQEAARLLESARADAERARREAYDAGRRQAALEWHEQQTGSVIDKAQVLRNMHEKLATIVTAAVERIVHTEQREALYQRALRSVQGLARGASTLALRVNAEDYEHARAAIESLAALQTQGLHIEVNVDTALPPGGCVFESEVGILDASLQTQLEGLRAAMDRAVRKAIVDGDAPGDGARLAHPPASAVPDEDGFDEDGFDDAVFDEAYDPESA
ncbi:type III secretion system stator protein SctL [Methylibium rhizosphaerae]|jgi:type III secretion protein L|uniref:type III secretion system stator protein SctL n=1 Tax=Methylibium rhizosphaerae TaxID=2570323 RepID=UPI0015E402FD|nr:type III secretion system stator protein SctL [Methylibium rhizosphaerae]